MRKIDIRRIKPSSAGNNQILAYSNTSETWVSTSNAVLDNITVNANLTVNGTVTFTGSLDGIPNGNSSTAGILKVVDSTTNTSITVAAAANAVARLETSKADKASPTFTGTVNLPDTVISGNLTVTGNTTYINTTELDVGDNIIVLNADLAATNAPTTNAGIVINRGSSANVSFLWDEADSVWSSGNISSSGYLYAVGEVLSEANITSNSSINATGDISALGNVSGNNISATFVAASNASLGEITTSVITLSATTVNSTIYTGTANNANYFGGELPAYYTNATNLSTGQVAAARLPAANTSQPGIVELVDSVGNTSTTIAATANSVKQAYDTAIAANTAAASAYSNAYNDAFNLSGNAYSNAIAIAANADNITSGTLNTARLPATANISTSINVGSNLTVNTSTIKIGNSTVNVMIGAEQITVGNFLTVNSSGMSMPTGNAIINDIQAVQYVHVGNNVFMNTSAMSVGNSTVYTLIQGDRVYANGTYITSVDAATVGGKDATTLLARTDDAYSNAVSDAATDATTKASAAYSNAIAYSGNATLAYTNAVTIATTLSDAAYANAVAFSGNAALAYSNAVAFAANADNISSGTLNTARLPATANISTAINVGSNVNVNTSSIHVGNSTINVSIQSTGIEFPDASFQLGSALGSSSNTQLVFNDSSYSNGASSLVFVKTTATLTVGNTINSNNITGNTVTVSVVSGSNVTSTGNTNVGDRLNLGANGLYFSDGSSMTSAPLDPIAFAIALG